MVHMVYVFVCSDSYSSERAIIKLQEEYISEELIVQREDFRVRAIQLSLRGRCIISGRCGP